MGFYSTSDTPAHRVDIQSIPVLTDASPRRFREQEHHVSRISQEYVLLFLTDGTLHFSEDGQPVSVTAGEWYLQVAGHLQTGPIPSESPEYHYLHFTATAALRQQGDTDRSGMLDIPLRGTFSEADLRPFLSRLERTPCVTASDRISRQAAFLDLLGRLCDAPVRNHSRLDATAGAMRETSAGHLSAEPVEHLRGTEVLPAHAAEQVALAREMVAWLGMHLDQPAALKEMAHRFHFSEDALIRCMKRQTGTTPGRWLRRIRLDRARQLLAQTDDPLPLVAEAVGYGDVSLLHKAFKKETGMTPGQWRRVSRGL